MGTLTSSNSVLALGAVGVFDSPQIISGFEVDDGVLSQAVSRVESKQGLDGKLVFGKVFMPYKINLHLMPGADDASISFFEDVISAQEANREVVEIFGNLTLSGINRSYEFINGGITSETPFASVRKMLDPFIYEITFEQCNPVRI